MQKSADHYSYDISEQGVLLTIALRRKAATRPMIIGLTSTAIVIAALALLLVTRKYVAVEWISANACAGFIAWSVLSRDNGRIPAILTVTAALIGVWSIPSILIWLLVGNAPQSLIHRIYGLSYRFNAASGMVARGYRINESKGRLTAVLSGVGHSEKTSLYIVVENKREMMIPYTSELEAKVLITRICRFMNMIEPELH